MAKLTDMFKGFWHLMLKGSGDMSVEERITQARLTQTKLKAVPGLEIAQPVSENVVSPSDLRKVTGELPALDEFKEVLGIDAVIPQSVTGTHRVSHVSQYRLTALVATIPEHARKAALGTTLSGTHVM